MHLSPATRRAPCIVCGYDRAGLTRTAACPECGNAPQCIKPTHMSGWEKMGVAALILVAVPPGGIVGLVAVVGAAVAWYRLAPDTPRIQRQSLIVAMAMGILPVLLWLALGSLLLIVNLGLM